MMEYLSIAICLSLLLLLSSCAINDKDADKKNALASESQNPFSSDSSINVTTTTSIDKVVDQAIGTIPVESENQLLPQKDQNFDTEFDKTYKEFVNAVYNKNLSVIDSFLDNEIKVSFGDDPGISSFYQYWNLSDNPEQSELWPELERIIELGGSYNKENMTFTAPYTFFNFPDVDEDEDFTDFTSVAVIDNGVKVYEEKDLASKVIAYLNYNIVKVYRTESDYWNRSDEELIKIETPSGKTGFIQKQFIRSPYDYRLSIVYTNNEWKLIFLVAGD